MSSFINENIQVDSIEAKMASTGNMKYILTDTNKKKYYFYQKAKGVDSDVYQSYTGMGLKKGDMCNVSFTEEAKTFVNKEGKTINYTDRFIGSLREASGIPVETKNEAPRASGERTEPSKDTDWDSIAVGKCQTAFLSAYIQSGKSISDAMLQVTQARRLAEKVVYAKTEQEEPPVIQQEVMRNDGRLASTEEEISIEDLPF